MKHYDCWQEELQAEEGIRGKAEQLRLTNEAERIAAESTRKVAEAGRQESESIRRSSEELRAAAELQRQAAATALGTFLAEAVLSEQFRVNAESARKTLYNTVKAAYESGAFNGAQGPQGPQGPKGDPGEGIGDMVAAVYDPIIAGKADSVHTHLGTDITTSIPYIKLGLPATYDELSFVSGVTSGVQGQLDTKATKAYVDAAVASIVDSAPAVLNTLNELATALGNDPNFATTISNLIGTKAPLASPTLTGTPTAPTQPISTNNTILATTAFVHYSEDVLSAAMLDEIDAVQGNVDQLTSYVEELDGLVAAQAGAVAAKANVKKSWDITLTAGNWTGSGPYTYTVAATGMLATDKPKVYLTKSSASATRTLEDAAFALLSYVATSADSITFTCDSGKPVTTLSLFVEVTY